MFKEEDCVIGDQKDECKDIKKTRVSLPPKEVSDTVLMSERWIDREGCERSEAGPSWDWSASLGHPVSSCTHIYESTWKHFQASGTPYE